MKYELKHHKPVKSDVGSYKPSESWSKYTHFAVMREDNQGMVASVGYFQNLTEDEEWGFEDYRDAAACIEQAQLYAHASEMFGLLSSIANDGECTNETKKVIEDLLNTITDISEPVKRLLGDDAMKIINHAINKVEP